MAENVDEFRCTFVGHDELIYFDSDLHQTPKFAVNDIHPSLDVVECCLQQTDTLIVVISLCMCVFIWLYTLR